MVRYNHSTQVLRKGLRGEEKKFRGAGFESGWRLAFWAKNG
jgi:hypothetical protein